MDRLIGRLPHGSGGAKRIFTDVESVSTLAQRLKLFAHATWSQDRGGRSDGQSRLERHARKSTMWVSDEFWREYHIAQAVKLTIIGRCFVACFERCAQARRRRSIVGLIYCSHSSPEPKDQDRKNHKLKKPRVRLPEMIRVAALQSRCCIQKNLTT